MPQVGNMAQNFSGIHGSESFFDRVKVAISFRFGKCCPRAGFPSRGLRVPALSLLSLPGDGVPGAVPSGEGCVRLVFRSGPDCAAGTSRRTFAASREQDRFPGRNTHGRSERVAAAVRKSRSRFPAIRRRGRLSRTGFCPQVRKAVFVISIFLSTTCGSARRSAALWDCRPACRSGGLPILRA